MQSPSPFASCSTRSGACETTLVYLHRPQPIGRSQGVPSLGGACSAIDEAIDSRRQLHAAGWLRQPTQCTSVGGRLLKIQGLQSHAANWSTSSNRQMSSTKYIPPKIIERSTNGREALLEAAKRLPARYGASQVKPVLCGITGRKATSVVIRPTAVWLVCAVAVVVVLPCWCVMAVLGFHMHCLGMGGKRPPPGEKNQLPPVGLAVN